MRKLTVLAILGLLAVGIPAQVVALPFMTETITDEYYFHPDRHTYMYASIVDFYTEAPDLWNDGVWIGTGDQMETSLSWQHTLPAGLQVPPDVVMKAKLKIDGEYVDTDGNLIQIQGIWDWDPLEHMWFDNSIYNLTDLESGLWNNGSVDVNVWAGEYDLRIDEAVLMMDYASAVPEPASLLLVGLGLLGTAAYRKLRKH